MNKRIVFVFVLTLAVLVIPGRQAVGLHTPPGGIIAQESADEIASAALPDGIAAQAARTTDGVTYYVDFDGGDDDAAGTSPGEAWKHAPGDPNAAGNPAAVSLQPGDTVLFKGGVVYRGQIKISAGGELTSSITYAGDRWPGLEGVRAIIDGAEVLAGWTPCQSQAEAGGNPNWEHIYYTYAPTGTSAFTANLHEGEEFLWISQEPEPPDRFVMDDYHDFWELPTGAITTTYLVDPARFNQADPHYWDGSYVQLWVVPNVVEKREIKQYIPAENKIFYDPVNDPSGYDRYSIINSIHALDEVGEYYFDNRSEPDGTHKVYLWPRDTASLANDIYISVRNYGIDLADHDYVTVEGFEVKRVSGDGIAQGVGIGTVSVRYKDSIGLVIRNNHIYHTCSGGRSGYGGIHIMNGINCLVENNYLYELMRHRAIFMQMGDQVVVKDNRIERVLGGGITCYTCVNNSELIGNELKDLAGSHANSITIYQDCDNLLVRGNRVECSDRIFALAYNNLHNTTIEYNVFDVQNGRAIANGTDIHDIIIRQNTLIGTVEYSGGSTNITVTDNILSGFCEGDDAIAHHNLYMDTRHCQGPLKDSDALEEDIYNIFVDPDAKDYRLLPSHQVGTPPDLKDPCTMSSAGGYVGALPCVGCTDDHPLAVFALDTAFGYAPLTVSFDASLSKSCAGEITSYEWDFGDGHTEEGVTASHTFEQDGKYHVSLTVTNSLSHTDTSTKTITVFPAAEPGLVAYLKFDDDVIDYSGREHHGQWQGGGSYADGIKGKAGSFDGTADGPYVTIEHDDDLDGMDNLTVAFWAKKNLADEEEIGVLKYLAYRVELMANGASCYIFNDDGQRFNISTNQGNSDTHWHHYALAYDGARIKLYVDGGEVSSVAMTGTVAVEPTRDVYIGKNPWGENLNGLIDEVEIYDRALSDAEIKQLAMISGLTLRGTPSDETIHLNWKVESSILPVTTTWHIDYYTQTVTAPFTATDPLSTTRAYTLTGLTNYQWYTVTLTAVGTSPALSDTVRVMPTDRFVYLPLVMREQ